MSRLRAARRADRPRRAPTVDFRFRGDVLEQLDRERSRSSSDDARASYAGLGGFTLAVKRQARGRRADDRSAEEAQRGVRLVDELRATRLPTIAEALRCARRSETGLPAVADSATGADAAVELWQRDRTRAPCFYADGSSTTLISSTRSALHASRRGAFSRSRPPRLSGDYKPARHRSCAALLREASKLRDAELLAAARAACAELDGLALAGDGAAGRAGASLDAGSRRSSASSSARSRRARRGTSSATLVDRDPERALGLLDALDRRSADARRSCPSFTGSRSTFATRAARLHRRRCRSERGRGRRAHRDASATPGCSRSSTSSRLTDLAVEGFDAQQHTKRRSTTTATGDRAAHRNDRRSHPRALRRARARARDEHPDEAKLVSTRRP